MAVVLVSEPSCLVPKIAETRLPPRLLLLPTDSTSLAPLLLPLILLLLPPWLVRLPLVVLLLPGRNPDDVLPSWLSVLSEMELALDSGLPV